MSDDTADALVAELLEDLVREDIPSQWLDRALAQHRRSSNFFPTIADLWPFLEHSVDLRASSRRADEVRKQANKALPAPARPPEAQRRQQVLDKLGYDPQDKRAQNKAHRDREKADHWRKLGYTPEQVAAMSPRRVLMTMDKNKPWWNELDESKKASQERIKASMAGKLTNYS